MNELNVKGFSALDEKTMLEIDGGVVGLDDVLLAITIGATLGWCVGQFIGWIQDQKQ